MFALVVSFFLPAVLGYIVFQLAYILLDADKKNIFILSAWATWQLPEKYCHILVFLSIALSIYAANNLYLSEYLIYLLWNFLFFNIIINDNRERKISSITLILFLTLGIIYNYFIYENLIILLYQFILSVMFFLGVFVIKFIYKFFRKVEGLGMGDCILISLIALWQGAEFTLLTIIISSITAIFYFFIFKKNNYQYQIPYGAFIGFVCLFLPLVNLSLF